MERYEPVKWQDHIEDITTGEVLQEGTPLSEKNLGKMDSGIFHVTEATIAQEEEIKKAQSEIDQIKSTMLDDIDCGGFVEDAEDATKSVREHDASPYAHAAMTIDGNAVESADQSADLETHKRNPNAHQNLIIDGNQ